MWFQDLFNYDFRRTEMCIIPYAHAARRDLVLRLQHRHRLAQDHREHVQDATVAEWNKKYGKHDVFAGGKDVPLPEYDHHLVLNDEGRHPRSRQR